MNKSSFSTYLAKPDIHNAWINSYRTEQNEVYFSAAFDKILRLCSITRDKKILDAGCGSANHAIRLAKRSYKVTGIDFSPSALELAKQKAANFGLNDKIKLQQGDLTSLPYADNTFDTAYCWGVLMHIPDVTAAVRELARVVKPGGYVALSENNKNSVDVMLRLLANKLRGRRHAVNRTEAGVENWYDLEDADSKLFVRHLDTDWITHEFKKHGLNKAHHSAGQFTESYIYFQNKTISKAIHAFNNFWFRHIGSTVGAYSNLFIFQKEGVR